MVKLKTKKMKELDQQNLIKKLESVIEPLEEFSTTMCECGFDLNWVRVGVITKLLKLNDDIDHAKKIVKQTHYSTGTYEENKDDKNYKNSTYVDFYTNLGLEVK